MKQKNKTAVVLVHMALTTVLLKTESVNYRSKILLLLRQIKHVTLVL